jgi:uncharacterized protein YxeA
MLTLIISIIVLLLILIIGAAFYWYTPTTDIEQFGFSDVKKLSKGANSTIVSSAKSIKNSINSAAIKAYNSGIDPAVHWAGTDNNWMWFVPGARIYKGAVTLDNKFDLGVQSTISNAAVQGANPIKTFFTT